MEHTIQPGALYTHYKGKTYRILAVGRHSESLEQCVVYQSQYDDPEFGNEAIWIRPLSMFTETIVYNGTIMPRFTPVTTHHQNL